MKKLKLLVFTLILIPLLISCAQDEEQEEIVLPEDRFEEYVQLWKEENFTAMYDMLSIETKETYGEEDFIDRYEKIYQDLGIENLSIDYTIPEIEVDQEPTEDEEVYPTTFPIHVSKDSIVGEIKFTDQLEMTERLIVVEQDEDGQAIKTKSDWDIVWHPGLIFPELSKGGTLSLVTTETTRGQIFDRNGNGLAINDTAYQIGVDTGRFSDNRDAEIKELSELLNMSVAAIESILNQGWVADGMFVPLKTVPSQNEELISELVALQPVITTSTFGRSYPYSESMAHLIGYIGTITAEELEAAEDGIYTEHDKIGKRGIEQIFENRLRGKEGVRLIVENENSKVGVAETPPIPGEDINLTIDAELQKMIYDTYAGKAGTTAAINPQTGETLALVSSPSFDPHSFTYGISQSNYNELVENPDLPLLNRFTSTYSPGSAFKPLTAMVGLRTGAITLDDALEIDGLAWGKEGWGNYQVRRVSESNGPVDLRDALVRSDNIYFAQKAVEIGGEDFVSGLEELGFGSDGLSFTYPIYSSRVSNSGEMDRETLLADSGYGQGEILITALHLAAAYTPIINQGTMIQPIFEMSENLGQAYAQDLITPEEAEYLNQALNDVVHSSNGTARRARNDVVSLSGKTGTAELKQSLDDEDGQENGWFVAYPETHDLMIAMMIEDIGDTGSGIVVQTLTDIYKELYK